MKLNSSEDDPYKSSRDDNREVKTMLGDYLNKEEIYSFNQNGTNPVTRREPEDLTNLTIKIGFAGITTLLMMSLVLFCIMVLM